MLVASTHHKSESKIAPVTKSLISVWLHHERAGSQDEPVHLFGVPLLIVQDPALLTVVSHPGERPVFLESKTVFL